MFTPKSEFVQMFVLVDPADLGAVKLPRKSVRGYLDVTGEGETAKGTPSIDVQIVLGEYHLEHAAYHYPTQNAAEQAKAKAKQGESKAKSKSGKPVSLGAFVAK